MKLFRNVVIVLIVSTFISCKITNSQTKEELGNSLIMITLKTQSRGFNQTLNLKKTQLEKFNFNEKDYSKTIEETQWEKAVSLLADVDIEELNNLKVPSTLHQSDASKAEILVLQLEDEAYQSPTYDQGNPPSEIKDLVQYIKGLDTKK